jgi:ABC transport system ATP-binding/permease protein
VREPAQTTHYTIGRSLDCEILVSSPRVSARHAELRVDGYAGFVRDLGSRYGTTINDRLVGDWVPFGPDDRIMVGNSELVIDATVGVRVNPARLGARVCIAGLGVTVNRGRKKILPDISLGVEPGEFVALMGGSGAGKSTLLKTIVGIITPSWGSVLINGINLATDPVRARLALGYVPQDDIVHSDLTVREALRYGATMRLPLDTTSDEIDSRVAVVMNDLDIAHTADTIIGSAERQGISGGQRKRVNLALELLPQPPLLLLDEPTSGLSSADATNVFTLLRQLADEGHSIIVTTHGPALTDFKRFDRVIYLSSGELAYFGPAWPESASYFEAMQRELGVKVPPDTAEGANHALAVLEELKKSGTAAQEIARRYEQSKLYSTFVAERLGSLMEDSAARRKQGLPRPQDAAQQFRNQLARYLRLKLRNRGSLPIQLAQAPTVAVLVNLVFGRAGDNWEAWSKIAFFMVVAAVWFGCSNAAREIVGERPILLRERMVGLGVAPYILSKLTILGALSAIQCAVLVGITYLWQQGMHQTAGHAAAPILVWGILWLCSMTGVLMGLTLSAMVVTSETALSATPLLLIPEILLAGLIVPVQDLPHGPQELANFVVTRWGFQAALEAMDWHYAGAQFFGPYAASVWPAIGGVLLLALGYCVAVTVGVSRSPQRFL